MRTCTLTLPWPPTVNHYWRSMVINDSVRVHISKEGKEFRKAVHKLLMVQRATHFGRSRLAVEVVAHPPDARARDLDNLSKSLLDALTDEVIDKKLGIVHRVAWCDDSQIDDYRIRRGTVLKEGKVVVTISELLAAPEQASLLEASPCF